jgi:hypothetical protein
MIYLAAYASLDRILPEITEKVLVVSVGFCTLLQWVFEQLMDEIYLD